MIGDAHRKIRQTNQKTLAMFGAVPTGGFKMVKKSPQINSNVANNFSSDVG
jgi:hypothetical protein